MNAAKASAYTRPALGWVKRRARRLQAFYGVGRRFAIFDAWRDYIDFTAGAASTQRLVAIPGGKRP